MPESPDPDADFIRNWMIIQKKDPNNKVFGLIENNLGGINFDQLNEENLLKELISLANEEAENDES